METRPVSRFFIKPCIGAVTVQSVGPGKSMGPPRERSTAAPNRMTFCSGSVARTEGPTDRHLFACCRTGSSVRRSVGLPRPATLAQPPGGGRWGGTPPTGRRVLVGATASLCDRGGGRGSPPGGRPPVGGTRARPTAAAPRGVARPPAARRPRGRRAPPTAAAGGGVARRPAARRPRGAPPGPDEIQSIGVPFCHPMA